MSGRVPVVAGNWKMHKTAAAARQAVGELLRTLDQAAPGGALPGGGQVWIAAPYTCLWAVRQELDRGAQPVFLAGQNLHWADQGAFTGEISAAMLVDAGCRAVIAGHSERRTMFGETDRDVARKVQAALAAGLEPVVCVGETAAERAAAATLAVVSRQVREAIEPVLAGRPAADLARMVWAYEPVWAIGTGARAGAADAERAAVEIRSALPSEVASQVRVLYGGSVNAGNVAEFMSVPAIDGVLVGGSSLDGAELGRLALAGLAARPR